MLKKYLRIRILAFVLAFVMATSEMAVFAASENSEEIILEETPLLEETQTENYEINEQDAIEEPSCTGYFSKDGSNYYADSNGILQNGWIKLGDNWCYFDRYQGSIEIPVETTDGYWYKLSDGRISYFDKKSTLITNCWKTISNERYYFDDEGFAVKGWYQDGNYWYYADENGKMVRNVKTIGEETEAKNYFFDANYRLSSGWKKIDGIYRYFQHEEDHEKCYEVLLNGSSNWVTAIESGQKCYIDASEGPVIGWKDIEGYRYHFNKDGFLDTGLFQDGRYHYFAETEESEESPLGNVVKGAKKIGDEVYGFHPEKYYRMAGWQTLDGERYYFSDEYSAVTGWYQEDNVWYYATPAAASEEWLVPEGAMVQNVKEIGEHTYFFDNSYQLVTGWVKIDNQWRYFEKAEQPEMCYEMETVQEKGWISLIDGTDRRAYVNSKNSLVKGWQNIDGKRYYFDEEGFLVIGWFTIDGKKYYAETKTTKTEESPIGNVVKGVKVIHDVTYVFHSKDYYTLKGWQTINGVKHYVNADGSVTTGWYQEGNAWYYIDEECVRFKGEQTIDGNTYYFDSQHRLTTGWIKSGSEWRYFEKAETPKLSCEVQIIKDGQWMILQDDSGRKSYVDNKNSLVKGWLVLKEGKYYFDEEGFLVTGWFTVGAGKYYANEDGILETKISGMKNTWWENEGNWYYFNSQGQLVKGFQTINNQRFYFDTDGSLKTGWFDVKGKIYYGEPEILENGTLKGSLAKGVKIIGEDTYVFHSTKYYRLSGFQSISGKRFYLNPENECRASIGWFDVKGKTYYGEPKTLEDGTLKGTLAKGAKYIDENTYVFHSSQYYRMTGFQSSEGNRYYLSNNGTARTGWFAVGSDLYYGEPETTEDGILKGTLASGAKEIKKINGSETYFFHIKSNYRLTGWQTIHKNRFYINTNGMAKTGWFTVGGKTYYGEPETTEDGVLKGTLAVGAKEINGKTYVFHTSKYYRLTGWQTVNNKKYYLKSNGVAQTGWFKVAGKWYYGESETTEDGILKGTLAISFKKLNVSDGEETKERLYYFDGNNRLVKGWKTISKVRYFFQKDNDPVKCYFICQGPSKTGWFTFEDGTKCYLNSKGAFLTGWQTIAKKKYYFNSDGIMQTGWCTISGKEYFFNKEGIYIPMTMPELTTIVSASYESADVSWKEIEGVKDYILQYSTSKSFPSWDVKTVRVTDVTTYHAEELVGNTTYYFRLYYTVWDDGEHSEISKSMYSAVKSTMILGEIEPTKTAAEILECLIVFGRRNESITINLKASLNGQRLKSADDQYYIVETESYGETIDFAEPVASVEKDYEIDIDFEISAGDGSDNMRQAVASTLMNKFALAVKTEDGSYQLISKPVGISNPEVISENTEAIFKPVSKKGIQAADLNDRYENGSAKPADDNAYGSNTKNTLFNIHLNDLVGTSERDGFVTYEYKGKTYYFSNCAAEQELVRNLVSGYPQYIKPNVSAINQVAVTFVLLLEYDRDKTYLIDPAAREKGHKYYALNVREEEARETFEALFLYLGEVFGQRDCYVTHWVLGNEVNSSKAWNYQGKLSFSDYMKSYAAAFRLLYNGVKASKTGNNVYISLDNGWSAAPDTYSGKSVLDKFAEYAQIENKDMLWSIAYHGYSYPLTRNDFWNDTKNTIFSVNTKYISMKNISVLTDYAALLETKYEKPLGSIRVILSEQGYNAKNNTTSQAKALAWGYYMAEFNDRIDAFIIRAITDTAEEVNGGLALGITDGRQKKRIAYFVYEYMDSDLTYMSQLIPEDIVSSINVDKFIIAQKLLCESKWEKYIPGFDRQKLAKMH